LSANRCCSRQNEVDEDDEDDGEDAKDHGENARDDEEAEEDEAHPRTPILQNIVAGFASAWSTTQAVALTVASLPIVRLFTSLTVS